MLRVRPPRLNLGPALRQAPFPLGTVTLSALIHLVLVGFIVVAGQWATSPEKMYVVNLVPAVPAVGTPQAPPTVAPPPPRVEEPPKREEPPRREEPPPPKAEEPPKPAPKAPPVEPPQREAVREMPARQSAAREMPPRDITARVPLRLREPMLPPQTPALPRPEQKELPNIASPTPTRTLPPPAPTPTTPTRQAAAPATTPLGLPNGSRQGAGAITLDVTDFPHAWYMREVQQKVSQKWDGRARDGQQPVAVFQIGRDGQITGLAIEKTSGNSLYDLAALRAITEASPFPPLPEDFRGPWLRIHLGFGYAGTPG